MKKLIPLTALSIVTLGAIAACNQAATSQEKVVGGTPMDTPAFMASLVDMDGDTAFCGGTFISPDVVVTAAHCAVDQSKPMGVIPVLKRNEKLASVAKIAVESIVVHENYDPKVMNNDIAILFLKPYDAKAFPRIKPLTPNADTAFPKSTSLVRVMGFGNTSSFGEFFEPIFQKVDLPQIPMDICAAQKDYEGKITLNQICAGNVEKGGADSCQGDSGGPLVSTTWGGQTRLVGIVSWGLGCATPQAPGVYTRVSQYRKWINDTIRSQKALRPPFTPAIVTQVVKRACFASFTQTDSKSSDSGVAVFTFKFAAKSPFEAVTNLAAQFPGSSDVADATPCSYAYRKGSLDIRMIQTPSSDPTVPAQVSLLAVDKKTGKSFSAPAEASPSVKIKCEVDGVSYRLYTEYGMFLVDGNMYSITGIAETTPVGGTPKACTVDNVVMTFVETADADGKTVAAVSLTAPELGSTPTILTLEKSDSSGMSSGPGPITINMMTDSTGRGQMDILNNGTTPVFTWQLTCPFAATLIGPNGERFDPIGSEADADVAAYLWTFRAATQAFSNIPANGLVTFKVQNVTGIPEGAQCSLNGSAVTLNIVPQVAGQ